MNFKRCHHCVAVLVMTVVVPIAAAQQKDDRLRDDFRKAFEEAYAPIVFSNLESSQGPAPSSLGHESKPIIQIADQRTIDAQPGMTSTRAVGQLQSGQSIPPRDESRFKTPAAFQPPQKIDQPGLPRIPSQLEFQQESTSDQIIPTASPVFQLQDVADPPLPNIRELAPSGQPQQDEAIEPGPDQAINEKLWWAPLVVQPFENRQTEEAFPDLLVRLAIQNSPRVLAISQQPLIQETQIGEARADFDPELFLTTQFDDRVDPVGDNLTAPGQNFLKDNLWTAEAGFRRKLFTGAQMEVAQRLGFKNSNSFPAIFNPQDQGTATLSIDFSQPLLKGRGRYFNRSQIMIAQVSTGVAWDRFSAELQEELVRVVEAYWTLYFSRSVLLQKQRNVRRGQVVLEKLEGRSGLDSLPSQIARARAAVESRRTELADSERDVKNSETEIRRLVGSPGTFQQLGPEIVPSEIPVTDYVVDDLDQLITDSMEFRPEVRQSLKRAKIAAIQKNVSKNELLPELNLIFGMYASALEGDSEVLTAWGNQFDVTPGYGLGLEFAVPYGRRAAKSRFTRQSLVVNQIQQEVNEVLLDVVAETQVAWRRVESAHQTLSAAVSAISAAHADLEQNRVRWESFGLVEGDLAEGQTPTTLLDQLLDAQQRLTNAELTYSQALLELKISEIELKRASGNLLNYQKISYSKACGPQGPETLIESGKFDR